jgi:hypothetical protein
MSKSLRAAAALLTLGMGAAAAQELRIERAMYGHDTRFVDVTETLRQALRAQGGRLDIIVSNQTFRIDPAPANPKILRVEYLLNGQPLREEIPENARLLLPRGMPPPPPPGGLRIVSARYGAGERFVDVTGVVQSLVRGGVVMVPVNPETMRGDPAFRRPKILRVEYEYMGQLHRVEVPDMAQLQLPEPQFVQQQPPPMPPPMPVGELRIVFAGYGAHEHFNDVTELVRRMRGPDGGVHIKVNNTNFGGDPYKGADKILKIDYEIQGRRMHREWREGEMLNLP